MPKKSPLPNHHKGNGPNRNYQGENSRYKGTPEQIKLRSSRNKARRQMESKVGHKLPTNIEVDHKNANALDDKPGNLHLMTARANDSKGHHALKRKK